MATAPAALTKFAERSVTPVSRSSDGTPPPVFTVIASLNVTVRSIIDPVLYIPLLVNDWILITRGAAVSTVIVNELDVLNTPLALLNDPASTEICASPEKPELGEKEAVYNIPDPVNPLITPPVAATSSTPKSVLTWSRVKVITAVPVPPKVMAFDAIETTGLRLSNVYVCVAPVGTIPAKALPAISVTVGLSTKPNPTTPFNDARSPPLTVTS